MGELKVFYLLEDVLKLDNELIQIIVISVLGELGNLEVIFLLKFFVIYSDW